MDVKVSSSPHKTQTGNFPRATLIHVLRIPFISASHCGASGRKRWRGCALLFKSPRLRNSARGAREGEYFIMFGGIRFLLISKKKSCVLISWVITKINSNNVYEN